MPASGSSGRVVGAAEAADDESPEPLSDVQPVNIATAPMTVSPSKAIVFGHRRLACPICLLAFLDMVDPFPSILIQELPTKRTD
jgi:hypothetical protein